MKMKKFYPMVALSLLFVMTVFVATCIAQEFKPITLRCAEQVGESSWLGRQQQWWANEVEKRTGGKIKVKFFWMDSLVKQKDALKGIQYGMTDLAFFGAGLFPSNLPLYVIIDNNLNARQDFIAGMLAVMETLDKEPDLKAEMEREKIMLIAPYSAGTMMVGTKKCYESIKDIKGQTIRTLGAAKLGLFKNLGANPVFMIYGEIYEALDRGTLQALEGTIIMSDAFKHYEIMKCTYLHGTGSAMAGGLYINLDTFKKLPKDIQEILLNLRKEYAVHFGQDLKENEAAMLREWTTKHGVTVKYPTPEDQKLIFEAAQKANDDWIKQEEARGNKAAGKVWDYYRQALKKYEDERTQKK
jgi:TRAP-type C4-dicarboxylate transport system substrate-binding protein